MHFLHPMKITMLTSEILYTQMSSGTCYIPVIWEDPKERTRVSKGLAPIKVTSP